MAILTVNNIKKMFGTDVIIQDITFEVQKGDRIGLVGINGSGKTTLFKVLNGRIYGGRRHLYPGRAKRPSATWSSMFAAIWKNRRLTK